MNVFAVVGIVIVGSVIVGTLIGLALNLGLDALFRRLDR